MEPISFGQIWPVAVASVRRHGDMLWTIAAAFLFLPQLIFARQVNDRTPDKLLQGEFLVLDSLAILLVLTGTLIAQMMIARLIMRDGTAGQPLARDFGAALKLYPAALALFLIQGISTGLGLLLFILPGLYMLTRLSLVIPLVATDQPDPIDALKASWALTSGRTLRVFGMIAVLIAGFMLLSLGILGLGSAIGVLSTLAAGAPAAGWGIGRWLFEMLNAGASAAFGTVYIAFLTTLMLALKRHPVDQA